VADLVEATKDPLLESLEDLAVVALRQRALSLYQTEMQEQEILLQHHHHKEILVVLEVPETTLEAAAAAERQQLVALAIHQPIGVEMVEMELHLLSPEHQ
jgi:hypothetical protein